jgi:hypothetical protein
MDLLRVAEELPSETVSDGKIEGRNEGKTRKKT